MFVVEPLKESSLEEFLHFLKNREDYSLFLLGNFKAHGFKLTKAPNSGNFKVLRLQNKIVAAFCLTRRGNLLVESDLSDLTVLEKILHACLEESLPILGVLGEWSFSEKLWDFFKKQKVITKENYAEKEVLYSVEPVDYPDCERARLLQPKDYPVWRLLRIDYLKETGLLNDLSEEEMHQLFLEKVKEKILWGAFFEETLVSIAELNAMAFGLGQVGGVYTVPCYRKKGLARSIMCTLMKDVREIHQIHKLIIFTGEKNLPAQKLYESLGGKLKGHYALLFGSN